MKKFYINPVTEVATALIEDIMDGELGVNPASAYAGEFDAPARGGRGFALKQL